MRNLTPPRRFFTAIPSAIIALFFVLSLYVSTAIAQPPTQSPVVVDGQPLFEVSAFGQYSAQERANLINLQIKEVIQASEPMLVRLEERNDSPAIMLNGRYLLTVTNQDTLPGNTPEEQAKRWVEELQTALQQAQAERSTTYLRQTVAIAIAMVVLAAGLHRLLGWLEGRYSQRVLQRLTPAEQDPSSEGTSKLLQLLFKLLGAIARTGLWVITVLYITNLFPFSRQWSYQITSILVSSFTSSILTLGNQSYTVVDLFILAVLLSSWIILAGSLTNLLRSRVLRFAGINRGAQEAIAILIRYSLIVIGTLVVLQVWGLDVSSLTILASTLGLGIGLGLQNIAKDFSSGLILVFERPIQVGDFVEVGNLKGTVERIGARSTEIRTLDQVSIIVPNSRFLETEAINWSHRNPISRLHLPVGVAYGSDPKAVRAALLAAAQTYPDILKTPPPDVLFTGFGDSSLNFELLVWTTEPSQQFLLKSELFFRIYEVLSERQIEIPFPQRDLHLRSSSLGLSPQLESALIRLWEKLSNGRVADAETQRHKDST
ncbi:MAG: mechanosensitive ion channel domain-containing protein [Nostocaceae cyanobacterium]|nr:mechanosensitive ion channel domain-containing protein [Nostocaceae cyanobacterium]